MSFNGWKNRETWNVSLWINNDEALYNCARRFMTEYKGTAPYADFVESMQLSKTGDGISFASSKLSRKELNAMMRELAE